MYFKSTEITNDSMHRKESDTFGEIEVPMDKLWGAQTQRSLNNFRIGSDKMPQSLISALILIKKVAAIVNCKLGKLDPKIKDAIVRASDEILDKGDYSDFPLLVWQTGSGTQTNMNINEVISNKAIQILGGKIGSKSPVHPNDHVNMGQSSNDTFPTAMYVAATMELVKRLLPALDKLEKCLIKKIQEFKGVVKIGRTHMQDATPLYISDEFSGYLAQVRNSISRVNNSLKGLSYLAQGGTATGTGLNTHKDFADQFIVELNNETGYTFHTSPNKFESLAAHDALVEASGTLNTLAVSFMKIANDIRLLGSGPRCGLGEIQLPMNEPGSSIMPGKVNPTQCEALTMVCTQVMGNHLTITIAGSQGNLELNAYKPVMIYNFIHSVILLSDALISFTDHCMADITLNREHIAHLVERSLMLATALNPHIGYDNAAKIVKTAFAKNISLRQAAIESGLVTDEQFSQWVKPEDMV